MLKDKTKNYLQLNILESLAGKTIVVTGANSGVGFKACEELLFLGANILMAVRNEEKGNAAKEELLKEYPNADIKVYVLDLASLDSIKKFVARIKRNKIDIYGFVNNAGVYHVPKSETKDGFEIVMGTNYIGTYVLTERLLPYLKTLPHDVKYVITSSLAYKKGKVDYNDFFCEKKYKCMKVYARSKHCLMKYGIYLANNLMYSNVRVLMTHPGATPTPLAVNSVNPGLIKTFKPALKLMQSVEKSALAIPYAIGNDLRPGTFVGPHGLFDFWGKPKVIPIKKKTYINNGKLISFTEDLLKKNALE